MHRRRHGRKTLGLFAVAATLVATILVLPSVADAGAASPGGLKATALTPDNRVTAAKSSSGKLAKSDPALLGRTDSAAVNVVVKLDYDATASYKGDVSGLAATSPSVTGQAMTGRSGAERAYESYTSGLDKTFRSRLASTVPSAKAGKSLQRVYGGVAVRLPANQVDKVLAIPGVAAVQADALLKPDTIESPEFIGAPTIWNQTGGQALSGKGVIFGDIDSGVWPEHPMLADNPALGAPPATASGDPRACDYGDNPLTPAADVFVCNDKLIGGQPFIDTYNAVVGGEIYPDSARDSNGHGTHTTTTAAGDPVTNAPIFGVDRGPVSGVAPGAWVMAYKVCGLEGCFSSDSAGAVAQAILDGVDVINFSISGGAQPYSDVVELSFLDAYDAGILVAASAGNSGPGAGTTDHHGPWVLTVAASTQSRQFQSTLTLADGATTTNLVATSLTDGVTTPTPIVLAEDIPGYEEHCNTELPPGSATGKLVACHRGGDTGRIQKGVNVKAGGAVGMILYNSPLADTESDNHFLPTVHLADGADFLSFMAAHPTATGSFTAGVKAEGQGDVMAAFSSRGPGGQFLKPDITAPGVQILAGNTPTPDEVPGGPPGEYYQAIAGTSMSSPHAAGSAILIKALHPDWDPGSVKSALMTTAKTSVLKEDLTTPADPFDMGAGRVDLTKAGSPSLVFDESAANMFNLGTDPITALDINSPSINVPTMPGTVTVTRTATNVTNQAFGFTVSTKAPAGSTIKVTPARGRIQPGASQTFQVTITSNAPAGQYFGQISIASKTTSLHLPVAFFNQQGKVTLSQTCDPATIQVQSVTTCDVTATNESTAETQLSIDSKVSKRLGIVGATGATVSPDGTVASTGPVTLAAPEDATPAIAPGPSPAGYLDLADFGVTPVSIGDEENINFNVPNYTFGDKTYSRIGIDSNGYISVGGSDSASDITFEPQTLPDPTPPNGVLAPYWTDLNGSGAEGIRASTLTDGTFHWVVVQWNVHIYSDSTATGARSMQVWIGTDGPQDISYTYDAATIGQDAPDDGGVTIGAENVTCTDGAQVAAPPTGDYVVTSTPGTPGGSTTVTLTVRGYSKGDRTLTSTMVSDQVAGSTAVVTPITVVKRTTTLTRRIE
jgi:hypothetical protein